jgi:hypothetical protein
LSAHVASEARKRFTSSAPSSRAYAASPNRAGFSIPVPTQHQKESSGVE